MRLNVILHGLIDFIHRPLLQMKAGEAIVGNTKAGGVCVVQQRHLLVERGTFPSVVQCKVSPDCLL